MTRATNSAGQQRQAIVFVAPGKTVDDSFARRIWTHCKLRRYEFIALVRDWPMVDRMLGLGQANIVVMPSPENDASEGACGEDWPVRLLPPAGTEMPLSLECVRRRAVGNGRFVSGRLSHDRVRELLDGPGEVTVPVGVDPESIAALRRIARRLSESPNESPSR